MESFERFVDFSWIDALDILITGFLIFQLYRLVKGTSAIYIFLGILLIYMLWMVVRAMEMKLLSNLLGQVSGVGVIALIVVFQQEIRKFLILLGSNSFVSKSALLKWIPVKSGTKGTIPLDFLPLIKAVREMARNKTGAIIALERTNDLSLYATSGDAVDAIISKRMLENIFYKGNPLHDGAVVISGNRIKAARCIFPLTDNSAVPARLGMRHRAAIGLTERTDALVITVSEETGEIAVVLEGEAKLNLSSEDLEKFLNEAFS